MRVITVRHDKFEGYTDFDTEAEAKAFLKGFDLGSGLDDDSTFAIDSQTLLAHSLSLDIDFFKEIQNQYMNFLEGKYK